MIIIRKREKNGRENKNIVFEVNEELLKLFGEKIKRIILYGSYARGDFNLESDIFIMILLNCNQNEIAENRKKISRIASRVGLQNDIMFQFLRVIIKNMKTI